MFFRYHTIIHPGDVFHLVDLEMNDVENGISIFPTDTSQPIILNNDQGIIIMHPDIMISPTRIAESCSCVRRGVLTERFKSFGGTSAAAVIGNVKHAFVEVRSKFEIMM